MQDGDISNEVAPRLLFVFEGLIGRLPDSYTAARAKALERLRMWRRAVRLYEIDLLTQASLWDFVRRLDMRFDVVTYKPDGFAEALEDWLDVVNVPVSSVLATTPTALAKQLAYMPYVKMVVDADRQRTFTYGDRGVIAPSVQAVRRWT